MKKILALVMVFASVCSFALPTAVVSKLKGKVTYNGFALNEGDEIRVSGLIKTEAKSFVRVKISHWGSQITVGPKAEMKLNLNKSKKKKYILEKGACRWISLAKKELSKRKKKGAVYTANAAMGIRGTDFYLAVNPLLGESEIVVLDGEVNFQSLTDEKDSKAIKKGQWGGLGGRYGNKIGKILDLPESALNHFRSKLNSN